jgi:hypothetical protein
MGREMPEGGQIVAALCGNLNPFARMARVPAGSVSGPRGLCRQPDLGDTLHVIRWGKTMFDFQDLFQWDRFNGPASTEIGRKPERSHFARQVQGLRNGGTYV